MQSTMSRSAPGPSCVLRGHRTDVQAVCCHPEKELLFSGDAEGEGKVWNLTSERAISSQRLHPTQAGITELHVLSSSCTTLLSQGRDGTIKQWLLSVEGILSREPLQVIETGSYNFCRIAVYTPESAASTSHQQHANASLGQVNHSPQTDLVFHQQDSFQPQGGTGVEHHRQLHAETASTTLPEEHAALQTAGPALVAVAGHDPAVLEIWNLQTGDPMKQLHQPEGVKHGMCMAVQLFKQPPQSTLYALVGYEDGEITVWDIFQSRMLASKHLHDEPVMAVAVDVKGTGGLCAAADNKVHCFSLDMSAQPLKLSATLEVKQQGIADICIRQDQRLFATAGWDGKIRVFHYKKRKALAVLQYHKKGLTALAFEPKTQRLVSASRDGNIALWSVFQSDRA